MYQADLAKPVLKLNVFLSVREYILAFLFIIGPAHDSFYILLSIPLISNALCFFA